MNMGSYSDSTSEVDEELPVFDFLHPAPRSSHTQQLDLVDLETSDAEEAAVSSLRNEVADVMNISSDSDDDVPYVPLAQRLKQRLYNEISTSYRKEAQQDVPSNVVNSHSSQNDIQESECAPNFDQGRTVNHMVSDCQEVEAALPRWQQPLKPFSSAESSDMSPVRRKPARRTVEDIQSSREEALRRRQAREMQQRENNALRLEQENQKAERKGLAEAAKALRPEECIKHMVVAVDPALLQLEGGGTLLASVQALGCSCAIEKQPVPRSVSWMRRVVCAQPLDAVLVPEPCVVMQMTVDDFITLTHSYIQKEMCDRSTSDPTLTSWVQEQQKRNPGKNLSLVVINLEKYYRSQKSHTQKKFRADVTNEEQGGKKPVKRRKNGGPEQLPEVSRVEVEEAVVHLQLYTGVSVRFLSTWNDFSNHITMTTKAIAEAPFKREKDKTGFSFYLESEWAGGQRVDKAGKGLLQVWKRQIQQLNRVSPDMASAILAAYPSPQLLKKAYSLCKTDGEKISLLSDLLIRRGEGVTSTTRRVGPELSKRLFIMMNSCDPEQSLDSTV